MRNILDFLVVILFLVSCNICSVLVVRFSLLLTTRTNFLARNFHICVGLPMASVSTVTAGLLQNVARKQQCKKPGCNGTVRPVHTKLRKKMVKKKTSILVKNREPGLLSSTGVGSPHYPQPRGACSRDPRSWGSHLAG